MRDVFVLSGLRSATQMMTIDLAQALACLNRLAALNMSPWLETVGSGIQKEVQNRIRKAKESPAGEVWAPWMPRTRGYREHKGNSGQGLLWDEGSLLNSISFVVDDAAQGDFFGAKGGVVIGTDVAYAGYLQDGTERMAARPFLGWSDAEVTELEFSAVKFIEALL
jgi:phage gpG-like protein